ncbi:transcriptional repressor NrdR [Candidatus Woesearchaeota archaeon]|jgi:transcriptional repressor NrdR|nr:transcriptional repressor NrdR [Candidatus Woesearchaeota archaeon]MBT4835030.1 transcriptional repressor NrdR [Candidatus Woesearchaeota archaeon]MBT6735351.1 transcriptional repressor NrdR [Candidatus Woesearchaeota archaeon]MBT7169685.1 transcriptional repressor NrdR [Candidatus Woesearchaeota archaeon]MBT7474796.1 transcriptional repressor NrdR [Candidatus Woesearchaeota archaeon]
MRCPFCNSQSMKVVDKRDHTEDSVRRRRECIDCERRFTTHERIENIDLRVVKKSGDRVTFDRNKLRKGIMRACEKRPISTEQLQNTIISVENELRSNDTPEIHSKIIGELVMRKLRKLDKVAYVRFASVYKDFADIGSFEDMINNLRKGD